MRSHRHGVVMRPVTISWLIPITLKAAVKRAAGQRVEWIRNGNAVDEVIIARGGAVTLEIDARPGDWFSLVVREGDGDPTVFANAIFVGR